MWQDEYEKLNTSEKEEFTRLVNLLLARSFILRDTYIRREKAMKINHDYRFLERHFDLFKKYLAISGWELEKDNNYGVIALYNRYEINRARVNKNITIILYVLRLIYDEGREKLSLKREIITKVSAVVEKMISLGITGKKPANQDLQEAFSFLKRFNIIEKVEGDFTNPETTIIIYPSILFVVTNEKITEIYDLLGMEEEEENWEEDTEEDAE
ncbi:MAG: DUF4194 domain-containing protein [Desulfitobacteriaceae bacterium]|nr:DUF4194 domain-containing protein [Desulfitobacteriaceae bacterium]MDD4753464.1 DUF4194 domain-containing protein [Desulfitobacteriaceae bacterium]